MKYLDTSGQFSEIANLSGAADKKYLDATGQWSVPTPPKPVVPDVLSTAADAQLLSEAITGGSISAEAAYSQYKDQIVTIGFGSNGSHKFRLVGCGHDDLVAGGKAGLSFFCEDCIGTSAMAPSNTNANGYKQSATTMQSYLTTLFNNMDAAWKALVKPVKKVYSTNKTATSTMDFTGLWLASMWEVGLYDANYCAKEGTTYKYFEGTQITGADTKRVRNNGSSAAGSWLRSGYFSGATRFALVSTDGSQYSNYADTTGGVVPGFCI